MIEPLPQDCALANRIIQQRGYLVIATDKSNRPGTIIRNALWGNQPFGYPLVVISETDSADFNIQQLEAGLEPIRYEGLFFQRVTAE